MHPKEILKHFTASFLNRSSQYPQDMPLTRRGPIQTNRGKATWKRLLREMKAFKKSLIFSERCEKIFAITRCKINEI